MEPAADREPMRTDDNGHPWLGRVLHRSVWRAEVEVAPWEPRFEIAHRRLVTAREVYDTVRARDQAWARIGLRILAEAGL